MPTYRILTGSPAAVQDALNAAASEGYTLAQIAASELASQLNLVAVMHKRADEDRSGARLDDFDGPATAPREGE